MNEQAYQSVWDAISDTSYEAANMKARSELMMKVTDFIKKSNKKQADAAHDCGITQPRLNDLLTGKISKFSLDALVNIATSLGLEIHIDVIAA